MTPAAVAAALLVAAAVLAGGERPVAVRRLRQVTSAAPVGDRAARDRGSVRPASWPGGPAGPPDVPDRTGLLARLSPTVTRRRRGPAVVAVTSILLLLAGSGLLAVLVLAGGAVLLLPGRRAAAAAARHDAELARALAPVADLLATCLAAGASLADALALVAHAEGGVARERLRPVEHVVRRGGDVDDAWRGAASTSDPWQPLWRAMSTASRSGSELAPTLLGVADDARARQRWAGEAAARRAGVRAVAPLAVCFLPAFLLTGVVPTVAGVAGSVLTTVR